jgi:hypothetical protein
MKEQVTIRRNIKAEPLDPVVIKLIDALARAHAREDHDQENASQAVSHSR